ncbi:MAG: YkgJ family cysteine cluster protein [Bacteroidetes bacterium]|nr:YkgJ family cysteine cluster protein [Bacteroidota bacterium]
MNQKEIGKIFYQDGYRLANQYLAEEVSVDNLKHAIKAMYEAVDGLLEAFLKRAAGEGNPVACKNGCAFCCHQPVFAITHEILYLKDFIRQDILRDKQDGFIERSREKSLLTLNKNLEEQQKIKFACPFLENSSCQVYEARPMACRIYLSSSVRSCEKDYEDSGKLQDRPELFEFPLQAGRMLNEGFVSCLKQLGLQSTELALEQGYASIVTLDQDFESWIG